VITHRVNAERIVLLGWSRAILLQLAHPLIAAGVAEHSAFRGGPLAAAFRLRHTVRAMLRLSFGDEATSERTLAGIRAIHQRVHGQLREATGRFPAGHPYSAEDPSLLLWVHVTLLDSVLRTYDLVVAPLSDAERDQYCDDAAPVAIALGARPTEVPRTWRALTTYLDRMIESDDLAVGSDASPLAHAILHPPLRLLTAPIAWINRQVTIGLLPDRVRVRYGFAWDDRRTRVLHLLLRALGVARRATPRRWAHWPEARAAARRPDRNSQLQSPTTSPEAFLRP